MRFKFIDAEKVSYPLTLLCRVMQVTRGGYYAWAGREPSAHSQRDAELLVKIRQFHKASRQRYGSPRIYDDLRGDKEAVGKKRVERLMREHNIVGKHRRKFQCTTDSNHDRPVAPNLLNQRFEAPRPDTVWSSDITQLRTPEGWLYLAVVLDLFARFVVGWALRRDITRQLVLDAVTMAIQRRKPDPGLIFHSDQGSQYAADDTETLLRRHGMTPSMSGVGNCYDNAVSESFFSGFKIELGDTFPSRSQGRTDTFEFIETYYNPYRRHSFNGNLSPRDCEAFFARNGRRPTGVKDLLAEDTCAAAVNNSQGKGAPSPAPALILPPFTAVQIQCTGGHTPPN
jgi:transposase InsO family protein